MPKELVKTKKEVTVSVRPLQDEDESFLYSSWIKSFRASSINAGLPGREYFIRQKRRIETILARENVAVLIACDPSDDGLIYGYVVFEMGETAGLLHYLYIKENFRKFGLAHELLKVVKRLPRETFLFTHYPPNSFVENILNRRGFQYDIG